MLQAPTSPHRTPASSDGRGWIYVQPNTGVIFRAHALNVLQDQVDSHRFAVAGKDIEVDLADGWIFRWLDEVVRQNPSAPSGPNPQAPDYEPPHVGIGRSLWRELHERAEKENEPYALRDWFEKDWIPRIPDTNGCRCRSNAVQVLNSMPPDYGPGFREYCIRLHNEINRRLGKKQWPYKD